MSDRYRKNIEKISSMVDGNSTRKIQVGYSTIEERHRVGDKWIDVDGIEWEQKDGYHVTVSKLDNAGIADKCLDCEKYVTKKWDKDVYKWNGRCYYCQIDFEAELRSRGNYDKDGNFVTEYDKWLEERAMGYIEGYKKEFNIWKKEIKEENKTLFDKKIVNAMANANVSMDIKKNTK